MSDKETKTIIIGNGTGTTLDKLANLGTQNVTDMLRALNQITGFNSVTGKMDRGITNGFTLEVRKDATIDDIVKIIMDKLPHDDRNYATKAKVERFKNAIINQLEAQGFQHEDPQRQRPTERETDVIQSVQEKKQETKQETKQQKQKPFNIKDLIISNTEQQDIMLDALKKNPNLLISGRFNINDADHNKIKETLEKIAKLPDGPHSPKLNLLKQIETKAKGIGQVLAGRSRSTAKLVRSLRCNAQKSITSNSQPLTRRDKQNQRKGRRSIPKVQDTNTAL
jgi:hypothetical protein